MRPLSTSPVTCHLVAAARKVEGGECSEAPERLEPRIGHLIAETEVEGGECCEAGKHLQPLIGHVAP